MLVDGALCGRNENSIRKLLIWITKRLNVDANRISSWLNIAAEHVSGEFDLSTPSLGEDHDPMVITLPCFAKTSTIVLTMKDAEIRLPRVKMFWLLKRMVLGGVRLTGEGEGEAVGTALGNLISYFCPMLEVMELNGISGLTQLIVSSSSLLELRFSRIPDFVSLEVTSSKLQLLLVHYCPCIAEVARSVKLNAPTLQEIHWKGPCPVTGSICTKKGQFPELLDALHIDGGSLLAIFGPDSIMSNTLLPLRMIRVLVLHLEIPNNLQGFFDQLKPLKVPTLSELELSIVPNGHQFGACVDVLLKKCTALRRVTRLQLTLIEWMDDMPCGSSCSCRELSACTWTDHNLPLLEELKMVGYKDTEHEREVLQMFARIGTMKKVSVVCAEIKATDDLCSWVRGLFPMVNLSFR